MIVAIAIGVDIVAACSLSPRVFRVISSSGGGGSGGSRSRSASGGSASSSCTSGSASSGSVVAGFCGRRHRQIFACRAPIAVLWVSRGRRTAPLYTGHMLVPDGMDQVCAGSAGDEFTS